MITMANRMIDNGKLGQYKIRERTKVCQSVESIIKKAYRVLHCVMKCLV